MNHSAQIETRFAQLANEVGSRPDLAQFVIERADIPEFQEAVSQIGATLLPTRPVSVAWRWAWTCAAALVIAAGVWFTATPRSLSAEMLAALSRVETVHVSGSTGRIVRKWPLERPATADASSPNGFPFEAWYWTDSSGVPRSFERQGPVTVTRHGGDLREFQQDVDLLYISEGGYVKDRTGEVSRVVEYLQSLERPGMAKKDLGTRRERNRTLSGLELRQGRRVEEIWWDALTFLPSGLTVSESSREGDAIAMRLEFAYDQPVPAEVAGYSPPVAKNVRYAASDNAPLAWREHVERIGQRLRDEPPQRRIAILPREGAQKFAMQWTLATPDGRHWVTPLGGWRNSPCTVYNFIRLTVASDDPARQIAGWRVPKEFQDLTFNHDLIYEAGVTWQEWVQAALAHFDLEYVDVEENRTVWVARHDGRTRKTWQQVKPPVPYIVEGGIEKRGLVKRGVGHRLTPVTLQTLFQDFNRLQAESLAADSIIIEDQTGLPRPPKYDEAVHGGFKDYWANVVEPKYLVATDSPYFRHEGSIEMATKWYREELGITFTQELRPMTVHVVRRKAR